MYFLPVSVEYGNDPEEVRAVYCRTFHERGVLTFVFEKRIQISIEMIQLPFDEVESELVPSALYKVISRNLPESPSPFMNLFKEQAVKGLFQNLPKIFTW